MTDQPIWLREAIRYIGTKEIPGPRTQALVIKWWGLIRAPFKDDETPWCAGFLGGILESVGIRSTRSAAALSYLKWGQPLPGPVPGAIAVKRRVGGGHVTFVEGKADSKGDYLVCVGGNQNDSVCRAIYAADQFVYRWPAGFPLPNTLLPLIASAGGSASNVREA